MTAKSSESYLSKRHPISRAQYQYNISFVKQRLTPDQYGKYGGDLNLLIAHMLTAISTARYKAHNLERVPLPYNILLKMGGCKVRDLAVSINLIKITGYSRKNKKCREYYFTEDFACGYAVASVEGVNRMDTMVNAHTGIDTYRRRKTTFINPTTHKPVYGHNDSIGYRALKIVSENENMPDADAMRDELYEMECIAAQTRHSADIRRYNQQVCIYSNIRGQMGVEDYYRAGYNPITSGRMYEIGGGMQGVCQRMKWAGYHEGIESGKYHNYDNVACHNKYIMGMCRNINAMRGVLLHDGCNGIIDLGEYPRGTQRMLVEKANYDLSMFVPGNIQCGSGSDMAKYCNTDKGRDAIHQKLMDLGVDEDECKSIPTSIFYGLTDFKLRDMGITTEGIQSIHNDILPWVYQAAHSIHDMLEWAIRDCARNGDRGTYRNMYLFGKRDKRMFDIAKSAHHGIYITNKSDCSINVMSCQGGWLKVQGGGKTYNPSRMLAHIAQGLESALWQRIILAQLDHQYTVMSPQHDGAITCGAIPDEVFAKVIAGLGLGVAKRVSKDKIGNDICMIKEKPFKRVIKRHESKRPSFPGIRDEKAAHGLFGNHP